MQLGGLLSQRVKHPKVCLLEVALWTLSTWYGTFLLCGTASLSSTFPYFHSFPMLSLPTRQQILLSWSHSYFFLLRLFFRAIKLLTLLVFFTQVLFLFSFFNFIIINIIFLIIIYIIIPRCTLHI